MFYVFSLERIKFRKLSWVRNAFYEEDPMYDSKYYEEDGLRDASIRKRQDGLVVNHGDPTDQHSIFTYNPIR